jgi:prepilin peptidase CpaA
LRLVNAPSFSTMTESVLLAAALAWALAGAGWDIALRRIPNKITYSGILVGIALRTGFLGWPGLFTAIAGGLLGGVIFFVLYLVRGMGAGDVKLITAIGCFVGPEQILQIVLVCALAGGVMAIAVMIFRKRALATLRNVGELLLFHFSHGPQTHPTLNIDNPQSVRLPYAVAIAAGTLYSFMSVLLSR